MRPPRARHLASLVHVVSLNLVAKLRLCQSCLFSASSSLVLLYVFVGYRLVLFMSCHTTIGLSFHLFRFSSPVTPINLVPPFFFSEDRTHVLVGIYSCGTHLLFTHLNPPRPYSSEITFFIVLVCSSRMGHPVIDR